MSLDPCQVQFQLKFRGTSLNGKTHELLGCFMSLFSWDHSPTEVFGDSLFEMPAIGILNKKKSCNLYAI